jgi:endonuclease III
MSRAPANDGLRIDWGRLLRALEAHYAVGRWRRPLLRPHRGDPFQVLISTRLSYLARDEATARASKRLFEAYPTASKLAKARRPDVEARVRPVGMARRKAANVIAISRELGRRHGGVVPATLEELLDLPGVGRKTANAVLQFAYDVPAITVDGHLLRVCNRITGWGAKTAKEMEDRLARAVPELLWSKLNPVVVQHGQNLCRAKRPSCGVCPIAGSCARAGVE